LAPRIELRGGPAGTGRSPLSEIAAPLDASWILLCAVDPARERLEVGIVAGRGHVSAGVDLRAAMERPAGRQLERLEEERARVRVARIDEGARGVVIGGALVGGQERVAVGFGSAEPQPVARVDAEEAPPIAVARKRGARLGEHRVDAAAEVGLVE